MFKVLKSLFKSTDERLKDIGFTKIEEDELGNVRYSREDNVHHFTHIVDILHKASGKHLLQSYDPDLEDDEGVGNTCVGLTGFEMSLFVKKMKEKGLA